MRLRSVADDAARGAEVEQDRRAFGWQQDVVGRDVAVKHAFTVQQFERVEHGRDHAANPRFIGRPGHRAARIAQGAARQVRHHHVGGAVVFPESVHLDQRRVIEARQQPRLLDERAQPDGIRLGERAGAHRDHRAQTARGERGRHVLLERDLAFERMVLCEVDDAEATDTEHADDLELAEARARRQGVVLGRRNAGNGGFQRVGIVAHAG